MFANITTIAATDEATDIHFGTWLGKREIRRAKTDFYCFAEHFLHKEIERLLKISKAYIIIDTQPLNLVKEAVGPCADRFIPVNTAGANDADRWLLFFHYPRLHTACMRAQ